MARRIPQDRNYHTPCPAAIKAKITELENAALDYAFIGAQPPEDREDILHGAQVARYNLERTILSYIEAALNAAPYNSKRTK